MTSKMKKTEREKERKIIHKLNFIIQQQSFPLPFSVLVTENPKRAREKGKFETHDVITAGKAISNVRHVWVEITLGLC